MRVLDFSASNETLFIFHYLLLFIQDLVNSLCSYKQL